MKIYKLINLFIILLFINLSNTQAQSNPFQKKCELDLCTLTGRKDCATKVDPNISKICEARVNTHCIKNYCSSVVSYLKNSTIKCTTLEEIKKFVPFCVGKMTDVVTEITIATELCVKSICSKDLVHPCNEIARIEKYSKLCAELKPNLSPLVKCYDFVCLNAKSLTSKNSACDDNSLEKDEVSEKMKFCSNLSEDAMACFDNSIANLLKNEYNSFDKIKEKLDPCIKTFPKD